METKKNYVGDDENATERERGAAAVLHDKEADMDLGCASDNESYINKIGRKTKAIYDKIKKTTTAKPTELAGASNGYNTILLAAFAAITPLLGGPELTVASIGLLGTYVLYCATGGLHGDGQIDGIM